MKDIIGISFDTDDMDDDNAFLMMLLKEFDTDLNGKRTASRITKDI